MYIVKLSAQENQKCSTNLNNPFAASFYLTEHESVGEHSVRSADIQHLSTLSKDAQPESWQIHPN